MAIPRHTRRYKLPYDPADQIEAMLTAALETHLARVDRQRPASYEAVCTASLSLTAAAADVTGASVTLTTVAPDAVCIAVWFVDFDAITANTAVGIVTANVDGVDQTPNAIFEIDANNNRRGTVGQLYRTTLPSAGSHTIKLRGQAASGTDNALRVNTTHTRLLVTIQEVG